MCPSQSTSCFIQMMSTYSFLLFDPQAGLLMRSFLQQFPSTSVAFPNFLPELCLVFIRFPLSHRLNTGPKFAQLFVFPNWPWSHDTDEVSTMLAAAIWNNRLQEYAVHPLIWSDAFLAFPHRYRSCTMGVLRVVGSLQNRHFREWVVCITANSARERQELLGNQRGGSL